MSRPLAIPLGPFDLVMPAGRGAMAEVWQATHRSRQVPVAVKVVTAPSGRVERFRRMFHDEVRATARLDHPGVIRLHDHGEIPAEVAAATRGRLPRGAPYLVMEWVGGGTLRSRKGRLHWQAVRSTLLALLDALAHAHARGVIHRDLKAANVLTGERGPVLTDFGLAFDRDHVDADLESSARLGTPNFMAPEQVAGDWRALGPWTDLYALGCLSYALAAGKPPFAGRGARRIMRAHMGEDPPALQPVNPVPEGFEDWIRRLMAKKPGDRYQFAADAAVGLLALPDVDYGDPDSTNPEMSAADLSDYAVEDVTLVSPPVFLPLEDMSWSMGPVSQDGRPPVPQSWRGPPPPPAEPPLPGVGRALFGMRETAFVGRNAARDQLWAALRRVTTGEGARAVLVEGPSGQGKSHLVAWMCQRAHELGTADSLRAMHDVEGGPGSGLGPMLERGLRCTDMPAEERPASIRLVLGDELGVDHELPAALAAVMDARGRFTDEATAVTVSSDRERYETICRAFDLLAWRRPLIIWLDDVQWGLDAVRFTDYLIARHRHLPVLVVGTVRDDALGAGTVEHEAIEELVSRRWTERLKLEPLDDDTVTRMVRARLPIGRSLADLICRRSAGSPLFAEQLVRHWIHTDALTDGPDGFRLKAGAEASLPGDLAAVWRARLLGSLAEADEAGWQALEGAAVLGMLVDRDEWIEVCARAGLPPAEEALERLLDERLARAEDAGRWAFAHAMLRETLIKRARDAGRWLVWNVLCAAMLGDRPDSEPGRLAGHLVAAGDHDAALAPLLEGVRHALGRGDYVTMRRLLLTRARTLRAARVNLSSPEWIENRVYWIRLDVLSEQLRRARRRAGRAVSAARALGEPRLLALALTELGRVEQTRDPQRGVAILLEAREAARASGHGRLEAEALRRAGWCLGQGGRFEEAEALHEEALELLGGLDDPFTEGGILHTRTLVAWKQGDLARAARMGARAMELFTRSGDRFGLGNVSNTLGDVARYRGDLAEAEGWYRQALRLKNAVGAQADDTELNLALTLVELGRFPEARSRILPVVSRARAVGHPVILAFCAVTMLPCDAYAADWASWDARWFDLGLFTEGKLAEPDAVRALRLAAQMARSVGEVERAEQAEALAARQDEALGRVDLGHTGPLNVDETHEVTVDEPRGTPDAETTSDGLPDGATAVGAPDSSTTDPGLDADGLIALAVAALPLADLEMDGDRAAPGDERDPMSASSLDGSSLDSASMDASSTDSSADGPRSDEFPAPRAGDEPGAYGRDDTPVVPMDPDDQASGGDASETDRPSAMPLDHLATGPLGVVDRDVFTMTETGPLDPSGVFADAVERRSTATTPASVGPTGMVEEPAPSDPFGAWGAPEPGEDDEPGPGDTLGPWTAPTEDESDRPHIADPLDDAPDSASTDRPLSSAPILDASDATDPPGSTRPPDEPDAPSTPPDGAGEPPE